MDNIAAGVNNFDEMIPAPRKIFDCLRELGLKLSAHKYEFDTTKNDYLGSTITPKRISHESAKIEIFWGKIRMPNTLKQLKRLIGFVHFFRKFIPNLGQRVLLFYKFLRNENVFTITIDNHESSNTLKAELTRVTVLKIRLAKPGLKYVFLYDASFHGTGFVIMIE